MFRGKGKPPSTPFDHGPDCKLIAIDPEMQIAWNDLGGGSWKRECVCSFELWSAPLIDDRVQLDPLDPTTARHAGECEFASETDPAKLKILLKVKPGLAEGYDWVECGACGTGWQVPHYAESVG